jgi:hypothetical protein
MQLMMLILKMLHPGFWLDLWNLRSEDEDLDLDWIPESQEEAEIQEEMSADWTERQLKKGRKVQ